MKLAERPVSEIMQREVATLNEDDRLDLADDIMKLGMVRHMPVVKDGRLTGIVSNRDLLAASLTKALDFDARERRAFLRSVEVSEVMTREVVSVSGDTPLGEAAELMLERRIGCLPVTRGDVLEGLVSETDLIRAAYVGGAGGAASGAREGASGGERGLFESELDELRRLRDELRVRVHLGQREAKDLWEAQEKRFSEAEARARALARRMGEPMDNIGEALKLLLEEIHEGYRRLREML